MQYNNQAYLSLVWKDPKERKQYLIGRLSKGEEFVMMKIWRRQNNEH